MLVSPHCSLQTKPLTTLFYLLRFKIHFIVLHCQNFDLGFSPVDTRDTREVSASLIQFLDGVTADYSQSLEVDEVLVPNPTCSWRCDNGGMV